MFPPHLELRASLVLLKDQHQRLVELHWLNSPMGKQSMLVAKQASIEAVPFPSARILRESGKAIASYGLFQVAERTSQHANSWPRIVAGIGSWHM